MAAKDIELQDPGPEIATLSETQRHLDGKKMVHGRGTYLIHLPNIHRFVGLRIDVLMGSSVETASKIAYRAKCTSVEKQEDLEKIYRQLYRGKS